MKWFRFKSKSLRAKLLGSYFVTTLLGLLLLIVCLVVIVLLEKDINSFFSKGLPTTSMIKKIEIDLKSSLLLLRDYTILKKQQDAQLRDRIWHDSIFPGMLRLHALLKIDSSKKTLAQFDQLKLQLDDMYSWQWRVQDVTQQFTGSHIEYRYQNRLIQKSQQINNLTNVLLQSLPEVNTNGATDQVRRAILNFQHYFYPMTINLIHQHFSRNDVIQTLSTAQYQNQKKFLLMANQYKTELSPKIQAVLNELDIAYTNYQYLLTSVKNEDFANSGAVAEYMLGHNVRPLSVKISSTIQQLLDQEFFRLSEQAAVMQHLVVGVMVTVSVFIVIVLIASILLAMYFTDQIVNPITRLREAVRRIALGSFDEDISDESYNEISNLIKEVNVLRQQKIDSQSQMKHFFDATTDAIITINAKGIIQSCNSAATTLFEYEKDELMGKNISMLMPEPHQKHHQEYIDNYLATGVKKVIGKTRELEALTSLGIIVPILISVNEIQVGNEQLFTAIIRDLRVSRECPAP